MLKRIIKEALSINEDYKINDVKNKEVKAYLKDRLKKGFTSDGLTNVAIARSLMVDRIVKMLAAECGLSSENDLEYEVKNVDGDKKLIIRAERGEKIVTIYLSIYPESQDSEFAIAFDIKDEEGFLEDVDIFDNIDYEKKYDIIDRFSVIYNKIIDRIVKFCKTGEA